MAKSLISQSGAIPEGAQEALDEILAMREEMLEQRAPEDIDPEYADSALNLLHYLVMRRRDLRPLQDRLAILGLSSLGRAESHVLANIDAVLIALHRLCHREWEPTEPERAHPDFQAGQQLLDKHTEMLLGRTPAERNVRIMVTMPSEAANDYPLVRELLQAGMDCMRINCAHDSPDEWGRMVAHLRRAEESLEKSCRLAMDLGGPKVRTGPIEPGAVVAKVRPERDDHGTVTRPARLWLTANPEKHPAPSRADAALTVEPEWLAALRIGSEIDFRDARGSKRSMEVRDVARGGAWAELERTAYLVPETELRTQAGDERISTRLHGLPSSDVALKLHAGEKLIISLTGELGRPATRDSQGAVLTPARISCILPEAFSCVRPGDSVWFDDGKIGGIIEKVGGDEVVVSITQTQSGGGKLRADKGINLPESDVRISALTDKDIQDLEFIAEHADIVELSFANSAADVRLLQQKLNALGDRAPAIVLKIETRCAFENLPGMLLQAMRWPVCGIMIARGDLAVECGFERLAEVQEEILWICEAAHVPVIWATQVLESLAKEGMASRSEVTDAAMAHRAECVMLNKGPHMVTAVRFLGDVLHRMQSHQTKKSSRLRELHLAHSITLNGSQ